MAGFKQHITVSTALGIGYGMGAHYHYGVPAPACVLATGLCSVSGMLPDIDSDSGVPLRESLAFAAAVVPMLMLPRFYEWEMSPEAIALAGGAIYLLIRFGLGALLKKYTVHRGMFHSLPAAAIFGEATFLICHSEHVAMRFFMAIAVVVGFLSHLFLDEIWSLQMVRGRVQMKKSFGTALKMFGDDAWANLSTYGKLALLTVVLMQDQGWISPFRGFVHQLPMAEIEPEPQPREFIRRAAAWGEPDDANAPGFDRQ